MAGEVRPVGESVRHRMTEGDTILNGTKTVLEETDDKKKKIHPWTSYKGNGVVECC